jgi:2-oxoglutarate ferredoxin oxidoreductase subunit delta
VTKKKLQPAVKAEWCKACGLCIAFCPQNVFGADVAGKPVVDNPENCIGCMLCDYRCPDFAITLTEVN